MKTNRTLAIYIPLKQNGVFRQYEKSYLKIRKNVSIPFEQGDVFRLNGRKTEKFKYLSLNPFRSGRCLSTRCSCFSWLCITYVSIPFEQGDVFRLFSTVSDGASLASQSLSIRAMSFDICVLVRSQTSTSLNPFRSRRCLSTELARMVFFGDVKSKSLSSRAMSFDRWIGNGLQTIRSLNPFRAGRCLSTYYCCWFIYCWIVSIPFEQGDVFRYYYVYSFIIIYNVSIPFDQGNVFRLNQLWKIQHISLNPFRSGQCLSTNTLAQSTAVSSLNPFRSGQCLSTDSDYQEIKGASLSLNPFRSGQCLSTYRMEKGQRSPSMSQSLSIRAMSFDCSGMLEAGIIRPFRPTSQFFGKVKELALDLSK